MYLYECALAHADSKRVPPGGAYTTFMKNDFKRDVFYKCKLQGDQLSVIGEHRLDNPDGEGREDAGRDYFEDVLIFNKLVESSELSAALSGANALDGDSSTGGSAGGRRGESAGGSGRGGGGRDPRRMSVGGGDRRLDGGLGRGGEDGGRDRGGRDGDRRLDGGGRDGSLDNGSNTHLPGRQPGFEGLAPPAAPQRVDEGKPIGHEDIMSFLDNFKEGTHNQILYLAGKCKSIIDFKSNNFTLNVACQIYSHKFFLIELLV